MQVHRIPLTLCSNCGRLNSNTVHSTVLQILTEVSYLFMGNGAWHTHIHPVWLMRIPETDVGVIVHFLPSPPLLVARLYQLGLPSEATGSTGGQLCLSLSSGCISANYIHKHSSDCCLVTRHNGVIATVTSQLGAAISFPREST